MRIRGRARLAAIFALAGLLAAPACVTKDEPPRRGMRVTPLSVADLASAAARPGAGPVASATLPDGSIAKPATQAGAKTIASRVVVEVLPLGSISYDGQVLPLVSPDGVFLAVQEGDPPAWEALLALPDAKPPMGTRLAVYRVELPEVGADKSKPSKPTARISRVPLADSPEPGLMLGRSCNSEGFLVESPRPDGSRWVGLMPWMGGSVQWLVRDAAGVASHAVLTAKGDLLYTRRPIGAPASELVLRRKDGQESTRRDPIGSYLMPAATDDATTAYALIATEKTLDIEALRLVEDPPGSGRMRLGSTLARRQLCPPGGDSLAYQAMLTTPLASPRPEHAKAPERSPLLLISPLLGRVIEFDVPTARFRPLASQSFAAIFWPGSDRSPSGYFCSTPESLVFVPAEESGDGRIPEVRVLGKPLVPRVVRGAFDGLYVFGPVAGDRTRLEVTAVAVGGAEPSRAN